MSNVNITDKLTIEIRNNVCRPFNDQYQIVATLDPETSQRLYSEVLVTPRQVALLKELPDKWVNISQSQSGRSLYVGHSDNPKGHGGKHWLHLKMPDQAMYYSYNWSYLPNSLTGDNIETLNSSWLTIDFTKYDYIAEKLTKLKAITADRDATLGTILKMLENCKTLNQVEKIWPAIRKYVSVETLQRLDHKPVRKTKETVGLSDEELQQLSVHHIRTQMVS